jgi:hypothetical protein
MMPRDEESDLDQALVDFFQDQEKLSKSLVVTNAPLSFPPLLSMKMGASRDTVRQEIEWMEHLWKQLKPQPRKFLDYVHRPVEIYLRHQCPERFAFADAIGSNQSLDRNHALPNSRFGKRRLSVLAMPETPSRFEIVWEPALPCLSGW